MEIRQAGIYNRSRTPAILALALTVGIILLGAFHHHEEVANDNHCLICLLLSSPALHVIFSIAILTAGLIWIGHIGGQPAYVPKPVVIIYSLRAPPVLP
jgi:hypothetical protein